MMESDKKWYYSKDELARKCNEFGIDEDKDLQKRQETASRIQNMGKLLDLSDICIQTAIVYMHRFYIQHSFEKIHRYDLMNAALFLAAQVHGMPVTLEEVIICCHTMLYPNKPTLDMNSEAFVQMKNKAKLLEGDLFKTLGPEVEVEHPHELIREICKFYKANIDLQQSAHYLASLSLQKTTMCLQYEPRLIACMSIHFACNWTPWKIAPCIEGKEWYRNVDKSFTFELLEDLVGELYGVLKNYPHLLGEIPRKPDAISHFQKYALNDKHHSKNKIGVIKRKGNFALPGNVDKPASLKEEHSDKDLVSSQSVHLAQTNKENKTLSRSVSIQDVCQKREKKQMKRKLSAKSNFEQRSVKKAHHALNDKDIVQEQSASNSQDPHSHFIKETVSKGNEQHHEMLPSASSVSKLDHHLSKKPSSFDGMETKSSDMINLTSNVSSDPAVVSGKLDGKSKPLEPLASVSVSSSAPQTSAATMELTNSLDAVRLMFASPAELSNPLDLKLLVPAKSAEPVSVTNSQVIKYHKHRRRLRKESTKQQVRIKSSKKTVPLESVINTEPLDLTVVIAKHKSEVNHSEYEKERRARKYAKYRNLVDTSCNKENSRKLINQANDSTDYRLRCYTDAKDCIGESYYGNHQKYGIKDSYKSSSEDKSSIKVESTEQQVRINTSKSPVPMESVTDTKPLDLTIANIKHKPREQLSEYDKITLRRKYAKYRKFYLIWNRYNDYAPCNKENSRKYQ